jgi:hypothetical protein
MFRKGRGKKDNHPKNVTSELRRALAAKRLFPAGIMVLIYQSSRRATKGNMGY